MITMIVQNLQCPSMAIWWDLSGRNDHLFYFGFFQKNLRSRKQRKSCRIACFGRLVISAFFFHNSWLAFINSRECLSSSCFHQDQDSFSTLLEILSVDDWRKHYNMLYQFMCAEVVLNDLTCWNITYNIGPLRQETGSDFLTAHAHLRLSYRYPNRFVALSVSTRWSIQTVLSFFL